MTLPRRSSQPLSSVGSRSDGERRTRGGNLGWPWRPLSCTLSRSGPDRTDLTDPLPRRPDLRPDLLLQPSLSWCRPAPGAPPAFSFQVLLQVLRSAGAGGADPRGPRPVPPCAGKEALARIGGFPFPPGLLILLWSSLFHFVDGSSQSRIYFFSPNPFFCCDLLAPIALRPASNGYGVALRSHFHGAVACLASNAA